MNLINTWNLWNYALGLFPFVLTKHDKFLTVKFSWPFFSLILAVRLVMTYFLFQNVCGYYNTIPGSEPQQFACYFIFSCNSFVTLHRMMRSRSTKRFLDSLCTRIPFSENYFKCAVRMAAANISIVIFKLLCESQSDIFSRRFIALIIGGSAFSWGPEIVQSQFCMTCYFLRDEFREVEKMIEEGISVESLKILKKRVITGTKLFEQGLKCYKLDLFIATQLGLLFFYVTINDIILNSFRYVHKFPLAPIQIWKYVMRLFYLLGGLTENMMYTVWLTYASTSVGSQVKTITKALYKKDVTRMDKPTKEEMLLTIDHLNDLSLDVDAYGFQTLNSRFLFKSFTTAMTFIFLFIQLFQLRN